MSLTSTAVDVRSLERDVVERISTSTTQIFFCGSHGGSVNYDGAGGPMEKLGGPMDRVFLMRSRGELGGDSGLDVIYGAIDFRTGPLAREIELLRDEHGDTVQVFTFDENPASDAVVVTGGITELDIPIYSTLFRGSVRPSEMRWILGDVTGNPPKLPYTAVHMEFEIHPALLERFGFDYPVTGVAISAWCKVAPPAEVSAGPDAERYGAAFQTQQHLGSLRIFVDRNSNSE